jgi:hypothetical protein
MTATSETDNLARGNHVVPTEFAQQLEVQRNEARGWADQWRECAELFVNSLCRPKGDNPTAKAFAEFDRLKGQTK